MGKGLADPCLALVELGSSHGSGMGMESELEASRGMRTDVGGGEEECQKERGFDSEEMFLKGDKALPGSSGNCFV